MPLHNQQQQIMNRINWKQPWQLLLGMLFVLFTTSCGDDEVGSENMISGVESKTWVAVEEQEAIERNSMQFYADGRFALGGEGTVQTGTWAYDEAARRITLQFEGDETSLTFEVLRLTDEELTLKAVDGSVLELEVKEV